MYYDDCVNYIVQCQVSRNAYLLPPDYISYRKLCISALDVMLYCPFFLVF